MIKHYCLAIGLLFTLAGMSQELSFEELGSEPALCRLYSYQNGGGVVYASATGGTPDYTYSWEELATGDTYSGTVWGGRNPGNYEITVTDAMGNEISETIVLDSLNVIANFHAFSDDLMEVPGGYVGFAPDTIGFVNTSENFVGPIEPDPDTNFFWNLDHPTDSWLIVNDFSTQYKGYYSGGEFEVCLVATNKNGCTDTICKAIGLFGSLVGLDQNDASKKVSLNTVPGTKSLSVSQSGFEKDLLLTIYNTSGQIVLREKIVNTTTTLPFNQPLGIYFYEISDAISSERLKTGKFNF